VAEFNKLKRITSRLKVIWYLLRIGTSMSAAPFPQTHKNVHNVQIQRWSCFV